MTAVLSTTGRSHDHDVGSEANVYWYRTEGVTTTALAPCTRADTDAGLGPVDDVRLARRHLRVARGRVGSWQKPLSAWRPLTIDGSCQRPDSGLDGIRSVGRGRASAVAGDRAGLPPGTPAKEQGSVVSSRPANRRGDRLGHARRIRAGTRSAPCRWHCGRSRRRASLPTNPAGLGVDERGRDPISRKQLSRLRLCSAGPGAVAIGGEKGHGWRTEAGLRFTG
jgi:hypothetical protein